jgi:hypothetical protein
MKIECSTLLLDNVVMFEINRDIKNICKLNNFPNVLYLGNSGYNFGKKGKKSGRIYIKDFKEIINAIWQ